jgi:PEP-CTERM motif
MRFSKPFLIISAIFIAPLLSQASPVKVTSDPTLSVGGFTFTDFSCALEKGGILATPSKCGQIKVGTITTPGTGIEFTSGFNAGFGSFDDAVLHYNVTSKTGISNIGLNFNGNFMGLAVSEVIETIFSGKTEIAKAVVSCSPFGCKDSDTIALDGIYHDLYVEKDIFLGAAYCGDSSISIIDQTFDSPSTPEPSSLALLGTGLLAAGLLSRRAKLAAKKAVNA